MIHSATGWWPDDILERLTWQDVADLQEGWREHPPLQWMVQGYLGIGGKSKDEDDGEFDAAVAAMGGQG